METDYVALEPNRYVDCNENCQALDEPVTNEEIEAAYVHWRHHGGSLGGCSHGC